MKNTSEQKADTHLVQILFVDEYHLNELRTDSLIEYSFKSSPQTI